jgi:hypothetical protein
MVLIDVSLASVVLWESENKRAKVGNAHAYPIGLVSDVLGTSTTSTPSTILTWVPLIIRIFFE